MTTVAQPRPSTLKTALGMMLNPGGIVRSAMGHVPWPFSLLVSASAFSLFFLQTGLDMMRGGIANAAGMIIVLSVIGALFGSVGVAMVAFLTWGLAKMFGSRQPLRAVIAAFGLCYSATLVYVLLGLACSLAFGWNTSLAFGVSGVLWALGPMIATVKELTGGRWVPSVGIATVCGGVLLFGWALLGSVL